MTNIYTVRKQTGTIRPQWGIYRNGALVEGGFSCRAAAEEYLFFEYELDPSYAQEGK
jgi:hypothetical protein